MTLASYRRSRAPGMISACSWRRWGDSFDGKWFLRIPRTAASAAATRGSLPSARLRCEPIPHDSLWLHHHCVVGDNTWAIVQRRLRVASNSRARTRRAG